LCGVPLKFRGAQMVNVDTVSKRLGWPAKLKQEEKQKEEQSSRRILTSVYILSLFYQVYIFPITNIIIINHPEIQEQSFLSFFHQSIK